MGQPVHPLVQLAREAIKGYLEKKEIIEPPEELTHEMWEKHGVFVCLKIKGRLRGCIGTFEPATSTVAEEIILNAISAATRDPRFMDLRLLPPPAYDIIAPEQQGWYYKRDEYRMVRRPPKKGPPGDTENNNRYTR